MKIIQALEKLNKVANSLDSMHLPELDEVEVKNYAKDIRKQVAKLGTGSKVGHICVDGSWCKWKANSCLSCGGWDGMRGRK